MRLLISGSWVRAPRWAINPFFGTVVSHVIGTRTFAITRMQSFSKDMFLNKLPVSTNYNKFILGTGEIRTLDLLLTRQAL